MNSRFGRALRCVGDRLRRGAPARPAGGADWTVGNSGAGRPASSTRTAVGPMAATCLRMPNSTAWCLIATQGSPSLPMDRRRDAEAFLASHAGDREIATYRDQAVGGIRSYIRAGNELMLTGWTAPHPDVTAAALLAGWPREAAQARRRFLTDLVATQTERGYGKATGGGGRSICRPCFCGLWKRGHWRCRTLRRADC